MPYERAGGEGAVAGVGAAAPRNSNLVECVTAKYSSHPMSTLRRIMVVPLAVLCVHSALAQSLFASSCVEDARIGDVKRHAINAAADAFMKKLLGASATGAYDMLSVEAKAKITSEQLQTQTAAMLKFEPRELALQHTYVIALKGNSPGRVVCATDLSKPDGWQSVIAASIPEQAHVIMSAEARNNSLAFTLWLVPEHGTWKVHGYWMNVASLGDKDSKQLWQLGHAQEEKDHKFNAALLFAAAMQVADRGPNFQLGITQSISTDSSQLTVPPELHGTPPFPWKDGGVTYKVLNVGPIAIAGKMYVAIAHEVAPWQSEKQVDGWNKELLRYFKHRFPEYSDVFAGVVARAMERGTTRGYGTVEELPTR